MIAGTTVRTKQSMYISTAIVCSVTRSVLTKRVSSRPVRAISVKSAEAFAVSLMTHIPAVSRPVWVMSVRSAGNGTVNRMKQSTAIIKASVNIAMNHVLRN